MKKRIVSMFMLTLLAATLVACGGETAATPTNTTVAEAPTQAENTPVQSNTGGSTQGQAGEAGHITVQHILIGFSNAVGFRGQAPAKAQARTQDQAKTLAYKLLDEIKKGADFDKLVTENTDDSPPGIYSMADNGVQPAQGEFPRGGMVPAFGNVGFSLKPGEVGMADYDPASSPYGYHIIKRLK